MMYTRTIEHALFASGRVQQHIMMKAFLNELIIQALAITFIRQNK